MQQTVAQPRHARPHVSVHILRGRSSRASREMVGDDLLIGSGIDCDVQMRSADIAERHCQISRSGRQVQVRRLHAEFPVYVNDESVANGKLSDGDRLRIGPFELKVTIRYPQNGSPVEETADDFDDLTEERSEEAITVRPHRDRSAESTVERRLRIVGEQLDRIEQQRAELDQLRGKIEQRQANLEREQLEQTRRHGELQRLESELRRRQQQVVEMEKKIENQRLILTEESVNLDGERRSLLAGKEKLLRVRRKAVGFLRDRKGMLDAAQAAVERQAQDLREAFSKLETERKAWQQLGEQHRATQNELQAKMDELATRFDQVERERALLAADRAELDAQVRTARQKEASLSLLETEISQRRQAVEDRESGLANREARFADDLARLKTEAEALERRAASLESESQRLREERLAVERRLHEAEVAEHRLADRQRDLDERIAQFDRSTQARTIEFELLNQSIRGEQELLGRRLAEAEERERKLEADAERQRAEEERLAELAGNLARDSADLDRKARELEQHAVRIASTCDAERKTLDGWRAELENEVRLRAAERESFESHKQKWIARFCRVREAACEMAQRRAILTAKERMLAAECRRQSDRHETLNQKEAELLRQCERLQEQRIDIHARQAELARRGAEIAAESQRLDGLSAELESRHQKLFDRERQWRDEVQRKRQELQELADRIERRQALLDRQTALHAKHLDKIKAIGLDALEKRKQAKAEVERVIARHEEYQRLLESARRQQRGVLAEVRAQIELAGKRDRDASAWLERIRDENEALVRLQSDFAGAIEQMLVRLPSTGESDEAVAVELLPREVEAWRAKIAACVDRMERFADALSERERHLEAVRAEESRSRTEMEKLLEAVERAEAALPASADVSPLHFAAMQLDAGRPTSAPNDAAVPAVIGKARVLGLVHRGRLAVSYRVEVADASQPCVLRLYLPHYCRDGKLRAIHESTIRSLRQLQHPGIAATIGHFDLADQYGVLVEWVEGTSMQMLSSVTLTPERIARWLDETLAALAAAHGMGFVHRRLSPQKLLIGADHRIRIIGFGEPEWLVKLRRCEESKAQQAYFAPEVLAGGVGDGRADLFAAGRVFGAVVDAASPRFSGNGRPAFILASVREIVRKLAAPALAERFVSATDAIAELRAALGVNAAGPASAFRPAA